MVRKKHLMRWDDKKFVLEAVKAQGGDLQNASYALRNDKEVVLAAVKAYDPDFLALEFASPTLKKDKDVVLAAIKRDGISIHYASKELKRDRQLVLEAVKCNGYALEYLNEQFRNDKEIVLEAVKHGFLSYPRFSPLEFASAELRNDKEVVMAAVTNVGYALRYASASLRNDKEVVLLAVSCTPQFSDVSPLLYASKTLKKDKEVVLAALAKCGNALKYASDSLVIDKKFIVEVLDNEELNFSSLGEKTKEKMSKDKELIFHAIKVNYDRLAVMDDDMIEPYKDEIHQRFVKTKDRLFDIDFRIPVLEVDSSLQIYKLKSDRVFEEYATLRFNSDEYDADVNLSGLHFQDLGNDDCQRFQWILNQDNKTVVSFQFSSSIYVDDYLSTRFEAADFKVIAGQLFVLVKLTSKRYSFFKKTATSLFTKRDNEDFDQYEYAGVLK